MSDTKGLESYLAAGLDAVQEKQAAKPRERIVASAIRQDGVVFTGPHHAQIIRYMVPLLKIRPVTGEQGFITSENRFVNRYQAARIAALAGQIPKVTGDLFSEDLWSVPDSEI